MANLLLSFAFVFFFLGIFWGREPSPSGAPGPWYGRFNLISAGLAAWVLAELIPHLLVR